MILTLQRPPKVLRALLTGLVVLFMAALVYALLSISARLTQQGQVIEQLRLDRRLLVSLVMHPGRHESPMGLGDDPAELVLSPRALQTLRKLPGVRSVSGIERREIEWLPEGQDNRPRKVSVLAVPQQFFAVSGIAPPAVDHILAQGGVLISTEFAGRLGMQAPGLTRFRRERPQMQAPTGGALSNQGLVMAHPEIQDLVLNVHPFDPRLPLGLRALSDLVFMGLTHPSRRDMPMIMPEYSVWIELASDAQPQIVTQQIRDLLSPPEVRVFNNAHLEVQTLAERMADAGGPARLQRMRGLVLALALGGAYLLVSAWVLLGWGGMRREMAVRMAFGQSPRVAMWRVARPLVWRALIGLGGGTAVGVVLALGQLTMPAKTALAIGLGHLGATGSALLLIPLALLIISRGGWGAELNLQRA